MESDLVKAKKYLLERGYGSGSNFTTNLVAVLMVDYYDAMEDLKRASDKKTEE